MKRTHLSAPPATNESLRSMKNAIEEIRWELRGRPVLDTSELEDALHFADGFLWDVVEALRTKADALRKE